MSKTHKIQTPDNLSLNQVEGQLQVYEDALKDHHPLIFWASLAIPGTMMVGALVTIFAIKGWLFTVKLLVAAAITFVTLGRLVILVGQTDSDEASYADFLTPNQLFFMVSYMDLAAAILVAFHIGLLFNLPVIGKRATSMIEDAKFVMNRFPVIQRAAFVGLTAFVAFPLAATGAVGGSILGTLLGLRRIRVFIATIIGCLIGNLLMLKLAEEMSFFTQNAWVRYSSVVVIIGLAILMEWRYRKSKENYHQAHPDWQ